MGDFRVGWVRVRVFDVGFSVGVSLDSGSSEGLASGRGGFGFMGSLEVEGFGADGFRPRFVDFPISLGSAFGTFVFGCSFFATVSALVAERVWRLFGSGAGAAVGGWRFLSGMICCG